MKGIKKHWWKALAVSLLMYTFIYGLKIPLQPQIIKVELADLAGKNGVDKFALDDLKVGINSVYLKGYNTDFSKDEPIIISLEYGESVLSRINSTYKKYEDKPFSIAQNIKVINPNLILCDFLIPEKLPYKSLWVRVNTKYYSNLSDTKLIDVAGVNNSVSEFEITEKESIKFQSKSKYFPNKNILNETIRNLLFHVPMWFSMMFIITISFIFSLLYLRGFNIKHDVIANEAVNIALIFAVLGLVTGSIWSKFTWDQNESEIFNLAGWWVNDPKQVGAAITTVIYIAYRVLRNSLPEINQRAKISAVYSIFAFILMIVFLMIYPKIQGGLHPGSGKNDTFAAYDQLDNTLRMIFYPAIIGWILLGVWMLSLKKRYIMIKNKIEND